MNSKVATAAAAIAAVLGLSVSQSALAVPTVAVSNLSQNWGAGGPLTVWRAQSFTVASGQDYVLANVTIALTDASSKVFVQIMSDNQSSPGTLLEQLSFSSSAAGLFNTQTSTLPATMMTYASTGLALTAGSTYWIVGGNTVSASTMWYATASSSETGLAGWSLGNRARNSTNSGASWGTPIPFAFFASLDVTPAAAVPESSTMAMMGAGLALLLLRRRASAQGLAAR